MSENTNTKSRPGEFDALEKARPDELIFTLLERDPCAPGTIAYWCDLRRKRATAITDDDARLQELRQVSEAEFIGMTMLERQKGQASNEAAPLPAESYSGNERKVTKAEELLPKLRASLAEADFHIHNALETARKLHKLEEVGPADLEEIETLAAALHRITIEYSPHRAALMAEGELPLEAGDD